MNEALTITGKKTRDNADGTRRLESLVGYHMRMAHVAFFKDFRDRMSNFGITPAHLGVLLVVRDNQHISQTDLSRLLRMDRSALVGVIDKLEGRGWIKRGKPVGDRRRNALFLTPGGGELLAELWPTLMEHESGITARLTNAERETLVKLLDKIGASST